MWDLPRPGLEPVSPALAGGFLTTASPEKPLLFLIFALRYFNEYVQFLEFGPLKNFKTSLNPRQETETLGYLTFLCFLSYFS